MMQTNIHTTTNIIQNNQGPDHEIVSHLKEAHVQFLSDYDKANDVFKPHVMGHYLFKIHTYLEQFNANPKNLSTLLQSIKSIRNSIKSHLTNIHHPLLNAIKTQEDKNILDVIKPLLDDKIAYGELTQSIQEIGNLLQKSKPHSEPVNTAWTTLRRHFQQCTRRHERNQKVEKLTIEVKNCMDDIKRNPWQSLDDKKQKYFELLQQLKALFPLLKYNNATSINEEYIDMLRAGFELTDDQKFIDTIHLCLELFYSKNNKPPQELIDYIKNSQKTSNPQSTLNNHSTPNLKKRARFEDQIKTDNHPTFKPIQKKSKTILKVPVANQAYLAQNHDSNQLHTNTEIAFINILNPLLDKPDLHPLFAAKILASLAEVSSQTMNNHGEHRFPNMLYNKAKYFGQQAKKSNQPNEQEEALKILKDIDDKLEHVKLPSNSNHKLHDADHRFLSLDNKTDSERQSCKDQFKQVITDFIDELKHHIPYQTEKDHIIWQLRMDLLQHLADNNKVKEHHISQLRNTLLHDLNHNRTQDPYINAIRQNLIQVNNANKSASATHFKQQPQPPETGTSGKMPAPHFHDLTQAVRQANFEEFQAYINQQKSEIPIKSQYCQFLINTNKANFTALHNAYDSHFDTFNLYIKEIKKTMRELGQEQNFIPFLMSTTLFGTNCFHQIIYKSENFDYIKKATQLLHKELGDDLYFIALNTKDRSGYKPCKPSKSPLAEEVNKYIENELHQYKRTDKQSYLILKSIFNHPLYHHNNGDSQNHNIHGTANHFQS